jgi:hypothetical protein
MAGANTIDRTGGGISNWSDSRACKTRDISMGLRRENGLFINLNYREGHKIINTFARLCEPASIKI